LEPVSVICGISVCPSPVMMAGTLGTVGSDSGVEQDCVRCNFVGYNVTHTSHTHTHTLTMKFVAG